MKSSVVLGQPRRITFLSCFSLEARLFHCGFLFFYFYFFPNPSLLLLLLKCFNQKLIFMLECSGLNKLCTYDVIRISIICLILDQFSEWFWWVQNRSHSRRLNQKVLSSYNLLWLLTITSVSEPLCIVLMYFSVTNLYVAFSPSCFAAAELK